MSPSSPPQQPLRLGILVPSSNTALEPLTTALLSHLPHCSVHFSRFPVTEIALSPTALAQFDDSRILAAAQLLADAHVDIIGWSGTSAGWLGLEADRRLCARIEEATGIRATTSVLGLCNILDRVAADGGERAFGLVTPYLDAVQERIVDTFGAEGYKVAAESHLNRSVNVEFADIGEEELDRQVAEVAEGQQQAVTVVSTFCTNLKAAHRVAYWEDQYPGLMVADTVATVVWDMLRIVGPSSGIIQGWGKVFDLLRGPA